MIIKEGAKIAGLNIAMRPVLMVCEVVFNEHKVPFVITSGLEGTHSAESLHYYGYAIDVRTRNIPESGMLLSIVSRIRDVLALKSYRYQVVLEENHIHIEYDVTI